MLDDEATKVIINAQGAVESAREHKEWEVEYMTFRMKIQVERDEAAERIKEYDLQPA